MVFYGRVMTQLAPFSSSIQFALSTGSHGSLSYELRGGYYLRSATFLDLGSFQVIWVLSLPSYPSAKILFGWELSRFFDVRSSLITFVCMLSIRIFQRLLSAMNYSSFRKPIQSLARNLIPMFTFDLSGGICVQMASLPCMATNILLIELNPVHSDRLDLLSCWRLF